MAISVEASADRPLHSSCCCFRQDVVSLSPKLVIINAGTNDVAENTGPYSEEQTFGNIVSMVEIAQANKIKVILTSTLPVALFGWNKKITDAQIKLLRSMPASNNMPKNTRFRM